MLADKERWEDYYSILQIHNRADEGIIAKAYRQLCKRYHPDVNKGANAEYMMQRVNAAHEVLADACRRAAYDIEWARRNAPNAGASIGRLGAQPGESAARALREYFYHIQSKDYSAAYRYVCARDRRRISEADFVRWQSAVSSVVELRGADAEQCRRCPGGAAGPHRFEDAFEYTVRICERERTIGAVREYLTSKKVVREGGAWGVYLGYRSVKPLTKRFLRTSGAFAKAGSREAAKAGAHASVKTGAHASAKTGARAAAKAGA